MNAKFSAVLKRLLPLPCAAILLAGFAATGGAAPANKVDFTRDIRPILSDNCYACHGPDDAHRKAKLRLDVRDSALASRDGKPAVVPGSLAKSELWRRINAKNDSVMPPRKEGKPLTSQETALLKKWLEQGAPYAEHWAFVPPVRPPVPTIGDRQSPIANPLDSFILAKLTQEKLKPSPPADKPTLLRRLSLDLIGLPPMPEELDAFLADHSPDAWSKQPRVPSRGAAAVRQPADSGYCQALRTGLPIRKFGFTPVRGLNFCAPPLSTSDT